MFLLTHLCTTRWPTNNSWGHSTRLVSTIQTIFTFQRDVGGICNDYVASNQEMFPTKKYPSGVRIGENEAVVFLVLKKGVTRSVVLALLNTGCHPKRPSTHSANEHSKRQDHTNTSFSCHNLNVVSTLRRTPMNSAGARIINPTTTLKEKLKL